MNDKEKLDAIREKFKGTGELTTEEVWVLVGAIEELEKREQELKQALVFAHEELIFGGNWAVARQQIRDVLASPELRRKK